MTNRTCLPKENPPHPSHPAALSPKRTTTVLWILFINQSFAIYHHHQHHQCAMVQLLSVDTHGSPWWRHGARTMTVSPFAVHCIATSSVLKPGTRKRLHVTQTGRQRLSLSLPLSLASLNLPQQRWVLIGLEIGSGKETEQTANPFRLFSARRSARGVSVGVKFVIIEKVACELLLLRSDPNEWNFGGNVDTLAGSLTLPTQATSTEGGGGVFRFPRPLVCVCECMRLRILLQIFTNVLWFNALRLKHFIELV